jgi:pre-rRNA-processing protein IPI3
MREVILTASGPISTPQSGSILFHDILNGSSLASFKQTSASKNCTAIVNSTGAQGGLMLAVQPDKSLLNVYSFQKVLLHIQDHTSVTSLTFPV